jgi:hypothetical protein
LLYLGTGTFQSDADFPTGEKGETLETCADEIQVERSWRYARTQRYDYKEFTAANVEAALQTVIENVKAELKHISGEGTL